jgi:hypothetical protein
MSFYTYGRKAAKKCPIGMLKIVRMKIVAVYFQVKITRSGINTSLRL